MLSDFRKFLVMEYNNSNVLISRTERVHYSSARHIRQSKILSLSNLDRKCSALMYLIFFYKPSAENLLEAAESSSSDLSSLFNDLKLGLEETLSTWYPAAGRLFLNPAEKGKIDLACNNSGAVLLEAETLVKISELGDLSQYKEFFEHLVFRPSFSGDFSELPLVVAQLTKFGCGGYALGVGINHSLFDGLASFNFLKAWAVKTNRIADNAKIEIEILQPVHERDRLLIAGHSIDDEKDRNIVRVMAFEHLYNLLKQTACLEYFNGEKKLRGGSEFVLKTFSISASSIAKLKNINGSPCSSFEVLAAHLWKARTKALATHKETFVCLQFTVDTRSRMAPRLPKSFAGNAYVLSSLSCTAGELEQLSLAAIVHKIKQAKKDITEEYVQAYVEALEKNAQGEFPFLPELTIVSDWTRTPYHSIDFFGLGTAVYASPLAAPVPQAAYFMQNPGEEGGTDVRIGLAEEHVAAFAQSFTEVLLL